MSDKYQPEKLPKRFVKAILVRKEGQKTVVWNTELHGEDDLPDVIKHEGILYVFQRSRSEPTFKDVDETVAHYIEVSKIRDESSKVERIFKIGDQVEKYTGDYQLPGEVRSVFLTKTGKVRYVVEHTPGFLHIYSAANLRLL